MQSHLADEARLCRAVRLPLKATVAENQAKPAVSPCLPPLHRTKLCTNQRSPKSGEFFVCIALFCRKHLLEVLSKLIGAGGGSVAAVDSIKASNNLLNSHALGKSAERFKIAVAAAQIADIVYAAIHNV